MSEISLQSIESRVLQKIGTTPKKPFQSPFITQTSSKKKEPKTFYNFNSIVNINNYTFEKESNGVLDEKKRNVLLNSFRNNVATFIILRKYKPTSFLSSPSPISIPTSSTPSKFSKFSKTKSKLLPSPLHSSPPIHLSFFFYILDKMKDVIQEGEEERRTEEGSGKDVRIIAEGESTTGTARIEEIVKEGEKTGKESIEAGRETEREKDIDESTRVEEVRLSAEKFQELFIQGYLDNEEGGDMEKLIEKMTRKYEIILRLMTDKQVKIIIGQNGVKNIEFVRRSKDEGEITEKGDESDEKEEVEVEGKEKEEREKLLIALFNKIAALYLGVKNRPVTPEPLPIIDSKISYKKPSSSFVADIFGKDGSRKEESENGKDEEMEKEDVEKERGGKKREEEGEKEEGGKRKKEETKNIIDILLEAKDIFDVDLSFMKMEIGEYPELPEIQFKDDNEKEVFKEIHKWLHEMEMELEEENRVILEYRNSRMEDFGIFSEVVEEKEDEDDEEEEDD